MPASPSKISVVAARTPGVFRRPKGGFMGGGGLGKELQPGDICAQGGVYQVTHRAHRATHQVAVRKGDQFPRCNGCGDAVRFRLITETAGDPGPHDPERRRTAGQGS